MTRRHPTPRASDAGPNATYFLVIDRRTSVCSYTWRAGTRSTSFYVSPRFTPLAAVKISLHGPDPRHPTPGFKLAIDQRALTRATEAGGVVITPDHRSAEFFQWFGGHQVAPHAHHVVRIRNAWDMFQRGAPSGPVPHGVSRNNLGAAVPPPPMLDAVDVDLYVSTYRPYWPDEDAARRANAWLQPLRNTAGQYLTIVPNSHTILANPAGREV